MLFNQIIYGPIHSRRFGNSLGINLMPTNCKLCTFNCIYCECGYNTPVNNPQLPTPQQVKQQLLLTLQALNTPIDVITFSGNGEPTLHPQFLQIIQDTINIRNQFAPNAKITVLSNSTQLYRPDVLKALQLIDNPVLKLDSAINQTFQLIDQPVNQQLTPQQIISYLKSFNSNFTLQICFLKNPDNAQPHIDNTTQQELNALYNAINILKPKQIMIYCIDRLTPMTNLQKIKPETMNLIAQQLQQQGHKVSVSL